MKEIIDSCQIFFPRIKKIMMFYSKLLVFYHFSQEVTSFLALLNFFPNLYCIMSHFNSDMHTPK